MIDLLAAKRRCTPMGGALFFGGSSKSSQATTNTDARVVGGDASTNLSLNNIKGSAVNITTTDQGAVEGSLKLALAGVEGANRTARETVAASGGLLEGALQMAGEQSAQFADALEKTKNNDVRVLVVVGLAVVGIAGAALLRGKG